MTSEQDELLLWYGALDMRASSIEESFWNNFSFPDLAASLALKRWENMFDAALVEP